MELTPEDVLGNVLTYWFGVEYWQKSEPKNPTGRGAHELESPGLTFLTFPAYYDDLWRGKWFAKEELTAVVDRHIRYECLTGLLLI